MGWLWLGMAAWARARLSRRYDLSLLWGLLSRLLWWLRRLQLRLVRLKKSPAGDSSPPGSMFKGLAPALPTAAAKGSKLLRSIGCRNEIGDLIRDVRRQGNQLGISRRVGSLIS